MGLLGKTLAWCWWGLVTTSENGNGRELFAGLITRGAIDVAFTYNLMTEH